MPEKVGPCGWGTQGVCQRSPGAPGALCLCTDGSETGDFFQLKFWVGREVILDLWDLNFPLGVILELPFWGQAPDENCFEDAVYWEVSSADLPHGSLPGPHQLGWGLGSQKLRGGDRACVLCSFIQEAIP